MRIHLSGLITVHLLAPVCVLASDVVELPRFEGEIKIDGVLDEAVWETTAVPFELNYETWPAENAAAAVRTTVLMMEDGENVYIAFQAEDPEPEKIRAYLRDRDDILTDDLVGISIDTFNDSQRSFDFFVNALGVQADATFDEAIHQWIGDYSWDAIWDAAGVIGENGYVVEMVIPLDQLRFPEAEGNQSWAFRLSRKYPRDQDFWFENVPNDRGNSCQLCQYAQLTGLNGSKPGRDFEIVPTLTASQTLVPRGSKDSQTEAGITLRYGFTPDITGNLAINPDFSQVETDSAQLDVNNRFALFFPEKRPFFLEGADFFRTPINAVFTRTVADPDAGAKVTGKRGRHTFGLFVAEDAVTNLLFPGVQESDATSLEQTNTAIVGRYRLGFSNTSSVGALVTARNGDGYHNYLGGLDARWRVNDTSVIEIPHLQSETRYPLETAIEFDQPQNEFSGDATRVAWKLDARYWEGEVAWNERTPGFRADSGFVAQVGADSIEARMVRKWDDLNGRFLKRAEFGGEYRESNDASGRMLERHGNLRAVISGPRQSFFLLVVEDGQESWDDEVYDLQKALLYGEFQPTGGLHLGTLIMFGDQIDYTNNRLGKRVAVEPFINWNISRRLMLRFRGVVANLETLSGEKIFDARVADTRLTWQFNVRSFLRLTVQHSDVERNPDVYLEPVDVRSRDVGRQLLYSYKLNPQTVFFLGYSDAYVDDDVLNGLTVSDRNIFLKIGYAWSM